ncbi:MAG: hypothetical protein SGCHY_003683 [Lobulomycetales sp.]
MQVALQKIESVISSGLLRNINATLALEGMPDIDHFDALIARHSLDSSNGGHQCRRATLTSCKLGQRVQDALTTATNAFLENPSFRDFLKKRNISSRPFPSSLSKRDTLEIDVETAQEEIDVETPPQEEIAVETAQEEIDVETPPQEEIETPLELDVDNTFLDEYDESQGTQVVRRKQYALYAVYVSSGACTTGACLTLISGHPTTFFWVSVGGFIMSLAAMGKVNGCPPKF